MSSNLNEDRFSIVNQEVSRHLEDTETSKLAHWHAARVYNRVHRMYLGLPATLLSILLAWFLSIETSDFVAEGSWLEEVLAAVPIIVSLVVSLLSGLSAFLNLSDLSSRHRNVAESLHALWRDCKNFSTDFPNAECSSDAAKMVKIYRARLNDINRDAPQIPRWAWKSVEDQRSEGSVSYDDARK